MAPEDLAVPYEAPMTVKIIETAQPIAPKKDWSWGVETCLVRRGVVWVGEVGDLDWGDELRRRDWL